MAAPLVGSATSSGRLQSVQGNMGGVHRFVRWTGSDQMTLTTTQASGGGSVTLNNSGMYTLTTAAIQAVYFFTTSMAFSLGDVAGSADFTNLFERWKLEMVEVKLTPFYTQSDAPAGAGNGQIAGILHSVIDYNDYGVVAASSAGVNAMRERPSYTSQNVSSSKPLVWRLKPHAAISAYAAGFGGYANFPAPWCDTISAVEHYGLKWIFEVPNSGAFTQYVNFKLECRYHLAFTDVK